MIRPIRSPAQWADNYGGMLRPGMHVEVGPGWYDLVDVALTELYKIEHGPVITTIKEKFGALRIYPTKSSPEVDRIISAAVDMASTTCDVCGGMAHVDTVVVKGWIRTRCPLHVDTTSFTSP